MSSTVTSGLASSNAAPTSVERVGQRRGREHGDRRPPASTRRPARSVVDGAVVVIVAAGGEHQRAAHRRRRASRTRELHGSSGPSSRSEPSSTSGAWQPQAVERRPTLSLNEWAVLGVLVEKPRHGYDIAALEPAPPSATPGASPASSSTGRSNASRHWPRRAPAHGTRRRRTAPNRLRADAPRPHGLREWLVTPVDHLRDVRSALLLKLVLPERLGLDRATSSRPSAGRSPISSTSGEQPPRTDHVALWRHHSAAAVAEFLDALGKPDS